MNQSLGLLEVAGLLPAVCVADAMVKTANVRILAVEAARGNGWMTVKIEGSVDAVNAAIDAGVAIAKKMNVLISKKVIARPESSVFQMFGLAQEVEKAKYEPVIDTDALVQDVEKTKENEKVVEFRNEEALDHIVEELRSVDYDVLEANMQSEEDTDIAEETIVATKMPETEIDHDEHLIYAADGSVVTCNLCMDPHCKRKKGEFKTSCLHYIK